MHTCSISVVQSSVKVTCTMHPLPLFYIVTDGSTNVSYREYRQSKYNKVCICFVKVHVTQVTDE